MKKLLITLCLLGLGSPALAAEPPFSAQDFVVTEEKFSDVDVDIQTIKDVTDNAINQVKEQQKEQPKQDPKPRQTCEPCDDKCVSINPHPKHPIIGKIWDKTRKICVQALPVLQVIVLLPALILILL